MSFYISVGENGRCAKRYITREELNEYTDAEKLILLRELIKCVDTDEWKCYRC